MTKRDEINLTDKLQDEGMESAKIQEIIRYIKSVNPREIREKNTNQNIK